MALNTRNIRMAEALDTHVVSNSGKGFEAVLLVAWEAYFTKSQKEVEKWKRIVVVIWIVSHLCQLPFSVNCKAWVACKDEGVWSMHEWSAHMTSLRERKGFVITFQRTVWIFLQMDSDLALDLAPCVQWRHCSSANNNNLVLNAKTGIWRPPANWLSAGILQVSDLRHRTGILKVKLAFLTPRRSWAAIGDVVLAVIVLWRSCRTLGYLCNECFAGLHETSLKNTQEQDEKGGWKREVEGTVLVAGRKVECDVLHIVVDKCWQILKEGFF